jgi:hypothetical protein
MTCPRGQSIKLVENWHALYFGLEACERLWSSMLLLSVMGTRMSLLLRGYEDRFLIERSIRKFDFYLVTISKERVRLAARKAEFDFIRGALVARPLGRRAWTPNLIRLRNRISPH